MSRPVSAPSPHPRVDPGLDQTGFLNFVSDWEDIFTRARVLCPYQRGTKKYSDSIKCYDFTLSFMIYPKFYWSQKRNRCGGLFFMAINHLAIIFLIMNFPSFSCEQLPKKISTSLECEWETCLRLRITPQVMSKKWSQKTGLTRRCTRPEVSFIFLHCA